MGCHIVHKIIFCPLNTITKVLNTIWNSGANCMWGLWTGVGNIFKNCCGCWLPTGNFLGGCLHGPWMLIVGLWKAVVAFFQGIWDAFGACFGTMWNTCGGCLGQFCP